MRRMRVARMATQNVCVRLYPPLFSGQHGAQVFVRRRRLGVQAARLPRRDAGRGNATQAATYNRLRQQRSRLAALATKMLRLAASGAPAHGGGATAPGGGTGDRGGVSSNRLRRPGHSEDGRRCHRHAHARRARREAARCGHTAAEAARRGPDDRSACGRPGQRDAAVVFALCHVRRLPAAAHGLRRTARHQTPVGCRRDRTLSWRCSTPPGHLPQ